MRRCACIKDKQTHTLDIFGIFLKCFTIIFIIVTIKFGINIVKLNIVPDKYLMILMISLCILTSVCVFLLVNKKINSIIKILISVILIGLMIIYVYTLSYIKVTEEFVSTITTEIEETEEYYIVTLKSGNYDTLEGLIGKTIYTFMAEEDYKDIKDKILSKVDVCFKDMESIKQLKTLLLSNEAAAILISNSQYNILYDEDKTFVDNITKVYTTTHKIQKSLKLEENILESIPKYTIESGAFNIYISGIDTKGKISNVARSDANIILTVNTDTHTMLLTSIPRDYYVTLHSKGVKDKLTHSGIYGIQETYMTVEDLLGIDINYYVRVNFTTLEKVVDALGGVEVYSEYEFKSYVYSYKKGINYLNGAQALEFARERYAFASGDRQRVKNQQAVLKGIMNKVLTSETILTKYTNLLQALDDSFQTNISTQQISTILKGQISDMKAWNIQTNSLDGTGASMPTYSYGSELLYVMMPQKESIDNAKEKINSVLDMSK